MRSLLNESLEEKVVGAAGERGRRTVVMEKPGRLREETKEPEMTLVFERSLVSERAQARAKRTDRSTRMFFAASQADASLTMTPSSSSGSPPRLLIRRITESLPSARGPDHQYTEEREAERD